MGKPKMTEIKELSECPLFMTIEEVVQYLGFGRSVVDKWFHEKDFPVINDGIRKVCKYDIMEWLKKRYSNNLYNKIQEVK